MRRVARVGLVAVIVLMIATTRLDPVLSGGLHETSMPASRAWPGWGLPVRVIVEDVSGLVLGVSAGDQGTPPSTADDRLLVLRWMGGCSDQQIWLTLRAAGDRYVVDSRTVSNSCQLLYGAFRWVAMVTRLPIDPARVSFDELQAEVR